MNRWYRLPETGSGTETDPYRPAYLDKDGIEGWAGNKAHPNGSPIWVCRVHGSTDALDALADELQATQLSQVPTHTLNNIFGQDRDATGWREGFNAGSA